MDSYKINGLTLVLDKTPPKWSGTVKLKSNFKILDTYATSTKESLSDALADILSRFDHVIVIGVDINEVEEDKNG